MCVCFVAVVIFHARRKAVVPSMRLYSWPSNNSELYNFAIWVVTKCEWQWLPLLPLSLTVSFRLFLSLLLHLYLIVSLSTSYNLTSRSAPLANFRIFMHVLTCSSIVGVTSRCQPCNVLWSIYVCLRIYCICTHAHRYIPIYTAEIW